MAGLFRVFETHLRDALDKLHYARVDVPPRQRGACWNLDTANELLAGLIYPTPNPTVTGMRSIDCRRPDTGPLPATFTPS